MLGTLEATDSESFAVRRARGELVLTPRGRALAGKAVPPAPCSRTAPPTPASIDNWRPLGPP